jgi:transcriptional regulator with XRE-family HTH domain
MRQNMKQLADINKRFKHCRELTGLNQVLFAEVLGVSSGHISKIEAGKALPSKQLIKAVCGQFSIREDWLLNGIGPIIPPEKELTPKQIAELDQIYNEFPCKLLITRLEFYNSSLRIILSLMQKENLRMPDTPLSDRKILSELHKAKAELIKTINEIHKLANDSLG